MRINKGVGIVISKYEVKKWENLTKERRPKKGL